MKITNPLNLKLKTKAVLLFFILLGFTFLPLISLASDPKILEYDQNTKKLRVEIDGKEYNLDVPPEQNTVNELPNTTESNSPDPNSNETAAKDDSDNEVLKATIQKKEYAKGPLTTIIGSRLFTTPTDNLLRKHGFSFDFTHRFASSIMSTNAGDLWGLDNFAYTGIGLSYGIADNLEAHVYRTSILDAIEAGLKFRLLKEAKTFGQGAPFGLVLHSGIQTDNIQNSIDPYIQTIFSKVIIPKWFKIYASPTIAWKTPTIGSSSSKSAIFFTFNDPKHRSFMRTGETFAIPFGAVIQILPDRLSLFGEYMPVVSGFKEKVNGWSLGLQIISRLETHVWTLGVSNMPYSTVGSYVVGAPNNNWNLGFNIAAMIK